MYWLKKTITILFLLSFIIGGLSFVFSEIFFDVLDEIEGWLFIYLDSFWPILASLASIFTLTFYFPFAILLPIWKIRKDQVMLVFTAKILLVETAIFASMAILIVIGYLLLPDFSGILWNWSSWIKGVISLVLTIVFMVFFIFWGYIPDTKENTKGISFSKHVIGNSCGFIGTVTIVFCLILGFRFLGEIGENIVENYKKNNPPRYHRSNDRDRPGRPRDNLDDYHSRQRESPPPSSKNW